MSVVAAAPPACLVVLAAAALMLVASAFAPQRVAVHWLSVLASSIFLLVLLVGAGLAADIAPGPTALSRVSLGAGFWILLGAACLAIVDSLQRARTGLLIRLVVAVGIGAAIATIAMTGVFNGLSLAREYHARHDVFAAALVRHVVLVASSVVPAIMIGVPMGLWAVRRPRAQPSLFAGLNLLQTIPSIALFGLLIVPLSAIATAVPPLGAIGFGGIGVAPALIALVLYALLPIVRSTVAAIGGVDPAVLDAARGMGLSRAQVLRRVELPLAAPLLLAGLRIVTVQAIGLAVVAALIGAGGLGSFIFEGLGQYAADLILLGALPAILLALIADLLFQAAAAAVAQRVRP